MANERKIRILIVDNEAHIREVLTMLLNSWGHHVCVATNGLDALQFASEFRPHLIVSDIAMPGVDGWEMMIRLRRLPEFQDTFCAALTGLSHDDERRRSYDVGYDVHLLKPLAPEELKTVIAKAAHRVFNSRKEGNGDKAQS
jgi:CheY-like chemotaxis protein